MSNIINIPRYSESERCFYNVRLDSYRGGCENNCVYCFSRAINTRFKQWNIDNIKNIDINKLKELFINANDKNKNDKISRIIKSKIPFRLGGVTDLFQKCEEERSVTFELIKLLNYYNHPYLIVTKSSLISKEKYLKIIDPKLAYVQISVTSLNEINSRILEPNASSQMERINTIKKLRQANIYTAARISPLIPSYEDGYFSKNKSSNKKTFNYFTFDLVDQLCLNKPNNIIIEFLRVSPIIKKILIENKNELILNLYNENSTKGKDGTLYFSIEEKEYYCKKIKEICDKNIIDFSICEDKDYEYFKKYWANQNDCCNAIGKIFNKNKNILI